jgi:hypothetical protein
MVPTENIRPRNLPTTKTVAKLISVPSVTEKKQAVERHVKRTELGKCPKVLVPVDYLLQRPNQPEPIVASKSIRRGEQ